MDYVSAFCIKSFIEYRTGISSFVYIFFQAISGIRINQNKWLLPVLYSKVFVLYLIFNCLTHDKGLLKGAEERSINTPFVDWQNKLQRKHCCEFWAYKYIKCQLFLPTGKGSVNGKSLYSYTGVSKKKAVKSKLEIFLRKFNFNFFNVRNCPIFTGFESFFSSKSS